MLTSGTMPGGSADAAPGAAGALASAGGGLSDFLWNIPASLPPSWPAIAAGLVGVLSPELELELELELEPEFAVESDDCELLLLH